METKDSKHLKSHDEINQQQHQILPSKGWEANLESEKQLLSRQILRGILMEDPINSTEQNEETTCQKIQLLPMNKSLDRCRIIPRNISCRNDKKNNQNLCFLFENELINKKIHDHPTNLSSRQEFSNVNFSRSSHISTTLQLPSLIPSPRNNFIRDLSSPIISNQSKLPYQSITNKSTDYPQNISSSYYPSQKIPDPQQITEINERKQTKKVLNLSQEYQQSQQNHSNPYFLGESHMSTQTPQPSWDWDNQQENKIQKKNNSSQHQFKSEVILESQRDTGNFTDREIAFRAQSTLGRDLPGKYKLLPGARFTSLEAPMKLTFLPSNQQNIHRETYQNDQSNRHTLNASIKNNNSLFQYDTQGSSQFCTVKQSSPLLHSNLRVITKIGNQQNAPISMSHLRQTLFQKFLKGKQKQQQGQKIIQYDRYNQNEGQGDMSNRRNNNNKDTSLLVNPGIKNSKKFTKNKECNVENNNKIQISNGNTNNRSIQLSDDVKGPQQQHISSQLNITNNTRSQSKDKSPMNKTATLNTLLKYQQQQQQSPKSSLPVLNQDIQGEKVSAPAVLSGNTTIIIPTTIQRSSSLLNTSKEMLRSAKRNFALPLNNNSSCLASGSIFKDRVCLSPMNFV